MVTMKKFGIGAVAASLFGIALSGMARGDEHRPKP